MEIRMAAHYGMCFGVEDAVGMALELTERMPLTILGDLVHNPDVVRRLDQAGARRARHMEEVTTRAVLLTAHGTSNRMRHSLREQGFELHDATCPLVERVHKAVLKLVEDGYFPVVIGKANHVEVRGLIGDLDDYEVIQSEADFDRLAEHLPEGGPVRLGIVCQTTWPIERAEALVEALRQRFPKVEMRFIDTVCQPTKDRQQAVRDLAGEVDVVIVVGGAHSNNSHKLAELARRLGCPAHRVARADELRRAWFEGKRVVGITAGTSTPNEVIEAVRERLSTW